MRMYLKNNQIKTNKKDKNTNNKFLYSLSIRLLLIIFLFSMLILALVKNFIYYYQTYAENEAKVLVVNAVNDIVNERIINEIDDANLYQIVKNKDDEIEMIDYNSYLINRLLNNTNKHINSYIKNIEEGKDNIFYVPLGSITQSPILNGKGPKMPVQMELVGSASSSVRSRVKNYGINNSVIEIYIHVEVEEKVILPVTKSNIVITSDIPISYKIIRGKIPSYYMGSGDISEMYMLPIN